MTDTPESEFLRSAKRYADETHPGYWEILERNGLDDLSNVRSGETPETWIARLVDLYDATLERPA